MSNANRKEAITDSVKRYEPTARERVAFDVLNAKRNKRPPAPCIKVEVAGGVSRLKTDHPDEALGHALIMSALGTADYEFYEGLLGQISNAASNGKAADAPGINFMLSVAKGIEPRDQIEAMLAVQMAAVHMASITFARRLAHVENIPQQDSAERAFNKLMRTFAVQVETLKRYRSTGEQRMTVEHQHVTVNEGGQAIVGNVNTAAGVLSV